MVCAHEQGQLLSKEPELTQAGKTKGVISHIEKCSLVYGANKVKWCDEYDANIVQK
jgi:hypothetical protein